VVVSVVISTDYGHLVAISRTLSEDNTLFNMINGKFEIDYPMSRVAANISSGNMTMISISAPNIVSKASLGYDASGLVQCSAMIQVDIASKKGNNSKYCRDVASAVKILIEGDVSKVLDQRYNIYIDRCNDNTFYNEEIGAWQSSLILYAYYIRDSK
jgi:uncharacterized membrane protein